MASGTFNTMAEGLTKLNSDITALMATPDADLPFLTDLQVKVLQKLREPFDSGPSSTPQLPPLGREGPPPPPELMQALSGNVPSGPPGGGLPPGFPPSGAGAPPMGPGPGAPNPDELRRLTQ